MSFKRQVLKARNKPKDWNGEAFLLAEKKTDGHRCTIVCDLDGNVTAHGKKPELDLWPDLQRSIGDPGLTPGMAVDGEVYAPSGGSQDVQTALIAGDAMFVAFDVPFLDGRRHHFGSGREGFDERDSLLFCFGFRTPLLYPIQYDKTRIRFLQDEMNASAIRFGIEGFVLKASASFGWWKQKPVRTVDCIILGVNEGEGRLAGTLGSIRVGLVTPTGDIKEVANVSGLTDEERHDFWLIQDVLDGQVMEVAYDCVQKDRLRFPRFIRLRDDKPAEECLINQIE